MSAPDVTCAEAGKIGAYVSWANTTDRTARTAPARAAFEARFEREVDPDGVLTAEERAVRAGHARKAYYARLRLKSRAALARRRAEREGGSA